jgi:hypothetical protein
MRVSQTFFARDVQLAKSGSDNGATSFLPEL